MGGDGGDGGGGDGSDGSDGNANDGSLGTNSDGSISGVSVSDFGGFGDNASLSDAQAAAAAQTGYGYGDFGSLGNYGNFGLTDPGSYSNMPNQGYGAYADAALGPGIGYGDTGGFGVTGYGNGISGFGGIGGFGNPGGFSSPGGFGNIGVATANDSMAGIATSMGLGINDAMGVNIGPAVAALGPSVGAALGTLGENAVGQAATPAQAALADAQNNIAATVAQNQQGLQAAQAAITAENAPISQPVSQQEATPVEDPETNPTMENLAAQNAKANQLGIMNPDGTSGKGVTTTSESIGRDFGVASPTPPAVSAINVAANINPDTGLQNAPFSLPPSSPPTNAELGIPNSPFGPTTAEGLGTIASNQAQANLAAAQAALGVANWGDVNAIDAQMDTSSPSIATVPGNFNIGIGSQSTASNVGAGSSSTGVASTAAPSSPSSPTATASAPAASSSVSAALANAINSETGFGTGSGLNFINPTSSVLLAQYPWLAFQPTS